MSRGIWLDLIEMDPSRGIRYYEALYEACSMIMARLSLSSWAKGIVSLLEPDDRRSGEPIAPQIGLLTFDIGRLTKLTPQPVI